ncbi:MAG: ATP-binding protein, partial [Micrococcales bacterium]|nr:ATP-binding protein [Micrococcales bacterium]
MTGSPRSDADPFGTAGLREAVLTAWRASPARFREDANTEEDHARGYYRDRVLVDLAQNAADAAVQAGSPGRLLISLETDGRPRLVVANTGTPLDTAGVAALASMRASAKRPPAASDQSLGVVGRFGVGFAAVRAVADEIEVRSTTGTVRFSLEATRALLASADGQLAAEVARRGDALPVLRLPLPGDRGPDQSADGYDTAVVAWLRDDEAVAAVLAQLDEVGDAMLLGLPGLVEIVVQTPAGPRRVADVADRWQVRTMTGTLDPQLLADRPVEERDHARWQVTWALPRAEVLADHRAVVHAPTPTDDPCTLPALLVATFPLDPTRRRVQLDTPVTAALVAGAATAYAALAADVVAAGRDVSPLVPTGMPAGELDAALHTAVVEALRHVPVLRGPADVLVPTHAVALGAPAGHDQPLVEALARRIGSLVGLPRGGTSTLRVLGVRVLSLDEAIEALSITSRPGAAPVWDQAEPVEPKATDAAGWTDLYDALAPLLADQSEALAGLPVPLADGRVVRGARGAVVLDEVVGALSRRAMEALGRWGLRVVHPDA